jgi:hypothetical protein
MSTPFTTIRKAAIVFFTLLFAAMMWPIHPFFSRIDPVVLGLPFSLFYLIVLIAICFLALLGLYLWDKRQDPT